MDDKSTIKLINLDNNDDNDMIQPYAFGDVEGDQNCSSCCGACIILCCCWGD